LKSLNPPLFRLDLLLLAATYLCRFGFAPQTRIFRSLPFEFLESLSFRLGPSAFGLFFLASTAFRFFLFATTTVFLLLFADAVLFSSEVREALLFLESGSIFRTVIWFWFRLEFRLNW
jgi:hypothetical protein